MIVIHGEVHSSKNSKQIWRRKDTGQPFITKSTRSKQDEAAFAKQLDSQLPEWKRMTAGKSYPLVVCFHFRRRTRAKFDYLNIAQGIADAMQAAGYFPDDSMAYIIPDFDAWPYEVCPDDPGCDIVVLDT